MSLNLDGRENKIKLISDTMTGFYSVMRNLQEDYATYHQNYSEEALALLSRSDDFIESVEAVRSLDSLSRIDDEGINELFLLSQQIAELYHLNVQERDKENPVTEVKSEKGFWQTVWGVMKGGRDSPIVRNSLEQVTGAIADIGDKIGNGLKSGVDWVIENEPDLPVYQRLCNPLFGFFMVGGAVQSWIQNRNLDNTSKNAVENLKAFQKGLADSFIEMGTGLLSLPKAVVDLYYKECEVGDDIAAYLDNCSPEQIPEDFRNWFNKSKEQVKEIGLELKKEVIRQLSEKDVKEYYETFGYLTGTIASFFIGAGEAKAASEAGKVGNATRIENAAITAGKVTKAEQTSKLRQASEKIENAGKKLKNKASKISQKAKSKPQVRPDEKQISLVEQVKKDMTILTNTEHPHNYTRHGNFGEMAVDVDLEGTGHIKRISMQRVESLDAPMHQGIDGIYENLTPPPKYIIVDSKYLSSEASKADTFAPTMGNTKNSGRQLGNPWIENNLEAEFKDATGKITKENQDKLDEILTAIAIDDDSMCLRVGGKVDTTGKITYYKYDSDGLVIKEKTIINGKEKEVPVIWDKGE